jgi:type IV secretory pathway VirB10-like protein
VAADLVRDFPADRIRAQIERVDWLRETKPKRVADVGADLAEAIRQDFAPPAGFRSQAERAEAEATTRARREREAAARQAKARARDAEARVQAYWEGLPPAEQAALEAAAVAGAAADDRAAYEAATGPARRLFLVGLRDAHIRCLLGLPTAD